MNNIIRKLQLTELIRKLQRRQSLHVMARVVVPFDFDLPCEVARYDDAKRWCAAQCGNRFVWSAQVPEKEATFGFARVTDALLFALGMPSASVHRVMMRV
jgi:hypothetical protein